MKRTAISAVFVWIILSMFSCKPNQAATKAAYEKAMAAAVEKPTISRDIPTDDAITEIQPLVTQSVEPRERRESVKVVDNGTLGKYNIVVGTFKQLTNAGSMRDRLIKDGYQATVVQNAKGDYRVIACSFDTREATNEARLKLIERYPTSYIKEPWLLIQE